MAVDVAAAMEVFDDLVSGASVDGLAAWIVGGHTLGDQPIRCPVGDEDAAAHQRLDLALRMLHGEEPCQWCRPVAGGTVVVRRWRLPARAAVLYDGTDDVPRGFVLVVGRPHGAADAWRFRLDDRPTSLVERARALLPT